MTSLNISKDEWIRLNQTKSKEEIKLYLHTLIETNNIQLPTREITYEEMLGDFQELCKLDASTLIVDSKDFVLKYDYKWFQPKFYIKNCNIGNKASDYFHQDNRMKCNSINAPSPHRSWNNRKFRDGIFNAFWTLKFKEINSNTIRQAIALRKYTASQYRPSAAKCVYNYFKPYSVLDFSSGWGDRLAGFCASTADCYTGVDPNISLYDGYASQIKSYCATDSNISLNPNCAEEMEYTNQFDLIFTSPPYFNIEKYSGDDKQSCKRYKKCDVWNEKFLFESIKRAWKNLASDGDLLINISDVYSGHTINKICDPMNDFINTLAGSYYKGVIGYQMAKRPNSKSVKAGVFCEPMWHWKKI
jgi:hypothetical protein